MKKTTALAGRVGIVTGSRNDLGTVKKVQEALTELGVDSELRVLSAHRSPDLTVAWVKDAERRGIEVIVACAGMANHLAGTVAAHTRLPVIGVPLASGGLGGLDSLLSTVQMPPGVPVATVSIDGVKNAAVLAGRILGIKYPAVRARVEAAATAERRRYEEGLRHTNDPVAAMSPARSGGRSKATGDQATPTVEHPAPPRGRGLRSNRRRAQDRTAAR